MLTVTDQNPNTTRSTCEKRLETFPFSVCLAAPMRHDSDAHQSDAFTHTAQRAVTQTCISAQLNSDADAQPRGGSRRTRARCLRGDQRSRNSTSSIQSSMGVSGTSTAKSIEYNRLGSNAIRWPQPACASSSQRAV